MGLTSACIDSARLSGRPEGLRAGCPGLLTPSGFGGPRFATAVDGSVGSLLGMEICRESRKLARSKPNSKSLGFGDPLDNGVFVLTFASAGTLMLSDLDTILSGLRFSDSFDASS
mmetsp:Transcript_389/g.802  ORF Transcript_389/g.802 Transcript_389/m.802 type:complete len:115 (+) Transcript_389:74-418(+)